jgi:DNA-binding CsgD family transcriptional regulator
LSKSIAVRPQDHQAILRFSHECRDLGDDADTWQRHFFAEAAKLIGADLVVGGELGGVRAGRQTDLGNTSWGWENGFNPAGWARALELLAENPNYAPQMVEYAKRVCHRPGAAWTGYDLVGEETYLRGMDYQEGFCIAGVHHVVWCSQFIPGGPDATNGAVFMRAIGRRDFDGREKAVLSAAYAAITPLIGGSLARFAEPSPVDLAPRVRAVLRCLLEGDGDKLIASRLVLSVYTVNQYTKVIYRHFGVNGRAELLARWVRRGWGTRFAWAGE